jgi:putative two-component system response regulator
MASTSGDESARALQALSLEAAHALAAVVDAGDQHRHHHSKLVAVYSAAIGVRLGMDIGEIEPLIMAARLHDVGMIGVPQELRHKPATPTSEERALIARHCEGGQRIVTPTGLDDVALWIRHHHERWDGTGYPDGLAGEAIPIESRIIAGADALDAMTTRRSDRPRRSTAEAIAEFSENAGSQFDPRVAEVVIGLLEDDALSPPDDRHIVATYRATDAADHLDLASRRRLHAALGEPSGTGELASSISIPSTPDG